MYRVVIAVVCLVIVLASSGFPQTSPNSSDVAKVKMAVAQLKSSGKRVVVITRNDERIKGYVESIDDDKFTTNDPKTKSTTTFTFREVKKVRKSGGLSTVSIVGIAVGVAAAAIVLAVLGKRLDS